MASATPQRPLGGFLPPDPKVEEPYLLTPKMAMRVAILGVLALIVFGVLFLRLWSLQILSTDEYRAAALQNQQRTVSIEAPRGSIVDRSGPRAREERRVDRRRPLAGEPAAKDGTRHGGAGARDAPPDARSRKLRETDPRPQERPADARDAERGRPRRQGRLPRRAPGRVPGRPGQADVSPLLQRRAGCSRRGSAT